MPGGVDDAIGKGDIVVGHHRCGKAAANSGDDDAEQAVSFHE
jgi:hypothetical protein